jgi:hypothetical protein
MTTSVLVPVSPDLVNALDVSGAFTGRDLDARGPSWVAFGPDGQPPFPELLPPVLGWARVINNGRPARRDQDNAQIMVDTSANPAAWNTAFAGDGLIHGGNNLLEADTPANRRAIVESWRTMAAVMSASARVEQTGWTFRPNGNGDNWVTDSEQPYASGSTATIGFHNGLQVDIPVPAGTSYLLCHGTDATVARGATLHVTQGGVPIASKSLDGLTVMTPHEASNGVAPVVIRLPGLKAGTITVTVDHAGLSGQVLAIIDALLPQSPTPRTIIGVKPVTLNAPTHDKPDLLAYYRTVPDGIRDEFANFIPVDPQPWWNPATMLGPDGLHPNVEGTLEHRDAIVTTIRAEVYGRRARVVEPTVWYSADSDSAQRRVIAAWKDAPLTNVELLGMLLDIAREQVLEYAPARPVDAPVPTRFVWAQLQHAKHLWNAGRVTGAGEAGTGEFSYAPRPLDKDIQNIIRPRGGVPSVF